MKTPATIGQAELEILHYVQEHHPITVRDVADHLASTKGVVRTTVLNVMERLREKNFLTRKKIDGVFHYSPRMDRGDLMRQLVRQFVRTTLGGNVQPFVSYLSEEASLNPKEVDEIQKLL